MSETSSSTQDEVAKRLRESRSLAKAYEKIMKDYPMSTVLLLGPAAPCDLLVIDDREGRIVAVEVKGSRPSSSGNRGLSKTQKKFGMLLESRESWKASLVRYVLYGKGQEEHIEEVPWKA